MIIKSRQLGDIEIDETRVISFPNGIPGFENDREYAIFPIDRDGPFYYMHAVNNPDLCLVLAVPFVFFPDYELELSPESLDILEIEDGDPELAVFTVLTIPRDFRDTTANLLAPIIVNPGTKKGIQYVPGNSRYQTKHRIFPQHQKAISAQVQEL
ncbi:MAG: flagellar assembly protein FliW [Bacillota bacterium]